MKVPGFQLLLTQLNQILLAHLFFTLQTSLVFLSTTIPLTPSVFLWVYLFFYWWIFYLFIYFNFILFNFTILYWFCHIVSLVFNTRHSGNHNTVWPIGKTCRSKYTNVCVCVSVYTEGERGNICVCVYIYSLHSLPFTLG